MQTNRPGPSHAGLNLFPTQGARGVQKLRNVGGMGGVGSISKPLKRSFIWSGVLEWMQNGKAWDLPCQVSAISNDVELKVDTWPSKWLMRLITKKLVSNIGREYLKDIKWVQFYLQQNEVLDSLTKAMMGGFAGCVRLGSMSPPPPQRDIEVLILLYDIDKKIYQGFIPNNQSTFVEKLRKAIQQEKNTQLPAPGGGALSASLPGGGMQPGMSSMSVQQPQQYTQGVVRGSGSSVQKRQIGQVLDDDLMAAIKQNLKKVQHLKQTLDEAHRHVKTLHSEFMLKQAYFKHQPQKLRRASPYQLRPHLPANPGFRHMLQQGRNFNHQPRGTSPRLLRPHLPLNSNFQHLLQQPRYSTNVRHAETQTQQFNYDSIKQ